MLTAAVKAVGGARHLLITSGAGMGVDSGLPDFRGQEGFWKAYPPYRKLGLGLMDMANPQSFVRDPALGWGFYGQRLRLYRDTAPHAGFAVLRRWAETKRSHFVITSNVDGHFQAAGFDPALTYEIHGSIHHLQCSEPCCERIDEAGALDVAIDERTMRATSELPSCPECGAVAHPNILMFGDFGYLGVRQDEQRERLDDWLGSLGKERLVIVELGAGTAVPSIRYLSERLAASRACSLIRINPRDTTVPRGQISLALGAREALEAIDERLNNSGCLR